MNFPLYINIWSVLNESEPVLFIRILILAKIKISFYTLSITKYSCVIYVDIGILGLKRSSSYQISAVYPSISGSLVTWVLNWFDDFCRWILNCWLMFFRCWILNCWFMIFCCLILNCWLIIFCRWILNCWLMIFCCWIMNCLLMIFHCWILNCWLMIFYCGTQYMKPVLPPPPPTKK